MNPVPRDFLPDCTVCAAHLRPVIKVDGVIYEAGTAFFGPYPNDCNRDIIANEVKSYLKQREIKYTYMLHRDKDTGYVVLRYFNRR